MRQNKNQLRNGLKMIFFQRYFYTETHLSYVDGFKNGIRNQNFRS